MSMSMLYFIWAAHIWSGLIKYCPQQEKNMLCGMLILLFLCTLSEMTNKTYTIIIIINLYLIVKNVLHVVFVYTHTR